VLPRCSKKELKLIVEEELNLIETEKTGRKLIETENLYGVRVHSYHCDKVMMMVAMITRSIILGIYVAPLQYFRGLLRDAHSSVG